MAAFSRSDQILVIFSINSLLFFPLGKRAANQASRGNRNSAECIIDIGEKAYWGKGYGSETLKLVLDYAFYEMNLHRVSLKVFSFKEKAIRLYEKWGFSMKVRVARACLEVANGMTSFIWGFFKTNMVNNRGAIHI